MRQTDFCCYLMAKLTIYLNMFASLCKEHCTFYVGRCTQTADDKAGNVSSSLVYQQGSGVPSDTRAFAAPLSDLHLGTWTRVYVHHCTFRLSNIRGWNNARRAQIETETTRQSTPRLGVRPGLVFCQNKTLGELKQVSSYSGEKWHGIHTKIGSRFLHWRTCQD